jgi:hypothetical protein
MHRTSTSCSSRSRNGRSCCLGSCLTPVSKARISGAPSSDAVELLGREHQVRGRTRPRPRLHALARARVDSGAV